MPTTSELIRQAILKRMGRDTNPDDTTAQDYQNSVNQVNQRGTGEIVGEALAGLGDAVGRIAGQNSNSLGTLIANKQNSRRQQIADYLTKKKLGDENIEKLKEAADQQDLARKSAMMQDPNSPIAQSGRMLYKLGTGQEAPPDMTPEQFQAQQGLLEKIAEINQKRESEKNKIIGEEKVNKTKGFEQENKLRDEHTKLSQDFIKVQDSYNKIQKSAAKPSAAGDLSLIYAYMKMVDPGSTVREGEYANAENSGGVPDKLRVTYNKMLNGERLSDGMRADFINTSQSIFSAQKQSYDNVTKQYQKLAESYGLDPNKVTMNYSVNIETPQAKSFNSIEEAERANLPKGTRINIKGRMATVQ